MDVNVDDNVCLATPELFALEHYPYPINGIVEKQGGFRCDKSGKSGNWCHGCFWFDEKGFANHANNV